MEADYIKAYWEQQGHTHLDSHWASWGDNWMIDLEIETIGTHLKDGNSVLDVGCANGYSTFKQAQAHQLDSITGVDFSANMIQAALHSKERNPTLTPTNFEIGDVRNLRFPENTFDVVYTTRVIINLPTW